MSIQSHLWQRAVMRSSAHRHNYNVQGFHSASLRCSFWPNWAFNATVVCCRQDRAPMCGALTSVLEIMCSTTSPEKRKEIVARWRSFRIVRLLWWASVVAVVLTGHYFPGYVGIPVLVALTITAISVFWPCPWCEEPSGFLMVGSFPIFMQPFGIWCQNCRRFFWGMRHGF